MGTCPGSMCHSARWHSATFRRHEIKRIKALLTKKYCEGGYEYSRIFIFKISIGRGIFLRNTKKTAILTKDDEKTEQRQILWKTVARETKNTKPLVVATTHDKTLSRGY